MQYRVLGPMEAVDDDRTVGLGGTKQRATLAFLLLHANRVVATSQLLKALWPVGDAPVSARKILQNAVWALRGVLSVDGVGGLQTRAPGYILSVDPEQVDLYRFHRLAKDGRERLSSDAPDAATRVLREALSLWRGPALADLVETGIRWSELTAMQNARLDAMEDCFEAELACGRHHAVLSELEAVVEAEKLRERSCGQLMLALYRCRRQADALSVYGRVRSALINDLGLDPGEGLQMLQYAILTHDPALALPRPRPDAVVEVPMPRVRRATVSVLAVDAELGCGHADRLGADEAFESAVDTIRSEVERFGGTVSGSVGSVSLALFGLSGHEPDDAELAVRAAIAIRDRLAVRAAVSTGEVLVRSTGGGPPTVNGALLEHCRSALALVPSGKIRICDGTGRATAALTAHHRVEESVASWQVGEAKPVGTAVPVLDRDSELDLVRGLMDQVRHRSRPHLVTVLGDPCVGKTELVLEFERRIVGHPDMVQFLVGAAGPGVLAMQAEILAAYCGILPGEPVATARAKLGKALVRLIDSDEEASTLLSRLGPLVEPGEIGDRVDVLDAWQRFLVEVAVVRPLVVVMDDLHKADDTVLDFVENLAESSRPVPMLVIVTARPELLERRPAWGGGKRQATTLMLDPLSDAVIDRLLDGLMSTMDSGLKESADRFLGALPPNIRQEPNVRRNYVRMLLRLAPRRASLIE